jgi:hypothetical protein
MRCDTGTGRHVRVRAERHGHHAARREPSVRTAPHVGISGAGVPVPLDTAALVRGFHAAAAISADAFARTVAFAVSQPEDVDINEILFRPTWQEM